MNSELRNINWIRYPKRKVKVKVKVKIKVKQKSKKCG